MLYKRKSKNKMQKNVKGLYEVICIYFIREE